MFFKKRMQVAILVGLSLISITAVAKSDFYIAPFGSYLKPDSDTKAFDGFGAGLALGQEINDYLNVEIRGFWQKYDNNYACCNSTTINLQGNSELTGGTLDIQWFLLRDELSPYIVAAVGGVNTAYKMNGTVVGKSVASSVDTTSFIFESGVGATYAVTDYLSLRSDVRYRLNTLPSNAGGSGVFNDLTVNFGVLMPLNIE